MAHSIDQSSLLPEKTANTTAALRFTPIPESINSYTLDKVKAIKEPMLAKPLKVNRPTQVRKTTLHGLLTEAQYRYQHRRGFETQGLPI